MKRKDELKLFSGFVFGMLVLFSFACDSLERSEIPTTLSV